MFEKYKTDFAKKYFEKYVLSTTSFMRTDPDFVIIGSQKSGTTSLLKALGEHPQILLPWKKEIHYFDHHYQKGANFYKKYFPIRLYKQAAKLLHGKCISGEASPFYCIHPIARIRIKETYPDIKLILIVRYPISRSLSHYFHNIRCGGPQREPLQIIEAFRSEQERIKQGLTDLTNKKTDFSPEYTYYSYLERSRYDRIYQNWLEVFNRESIHVICFEELCTSGSMVVSDLCKFLEIDNLKLDFPHSNKGLTTYENTDPEVISYLLDQLEPSMENFYNLLGYRLNEWDTRSKQIRDIIS